MYFNQKVKHKVFTSYYHHDDQYYKNEFVRIFGNDIINKSVGPGDISTDVSTEYIKQLIQRNFISDTSVLVVLVGPNTKNRKHVDWEISAALSKKVGGYSGLIGILLPNFHLYKDDTYYYLDIPDRLADNVKGGYADIYTWDYITKYPGSFLDAIDTTFNKRTCQANKIDNSREQMKYNRG